MQGVADGFEIVDETYLCPYADEAVQPLLRTDFKPVDVNFPGRYANAIKWSHSKDAKAWAAANAKTGTPAAWRPAVPTKSESSEHYRRPSEIASRGLDVVHEQRILIANV